MNGTGGTKWTWLALLTAAVTVAGSLYLSIGMGLEACALCFYQRTFAMAVLAVLVVGLFSSDCRGPSVSLLALPLAVGGLGVAIFHVSLEAKGILECPRGILDRGTAPQQSLAAFIPLTLLLLIDVGAACFRPGGAGATGESSLSSLSVLGACILGGLLALGCVKSSPPAKDPPAKGYPDEPIKVCRKPYRGPS
jgi:disulfide bond formation protein DsbB